MNDPLIDALAAANPIAEEQFTPPPALRALPRRHGVQRLRVLVLVPAVCALLALVVALAPAGSPGAAQVLAPAFAQTGGILYWRTDSDPGGAAETWMRVAAAGDVTALRERRENGTETVITQPQGLGQLAGAVARERAGPHDPIRTFPGFGFDTAFTDVVTAARKAARGALDLGSAQATTYDGRDAYAVRLPDAIGPYLGTGTPTFYDVTMWVARDGGAPLAVRWAHGEHVWRTVRIAAFEQLPEDPRLLDFG